MFNKRRRETLAILKTCDRASFSTLVDYFFRSFLSVFSSPLSNFSFAFFSACSLIFFACSALSPANRPVSVSGHTTHNLSLHFLQHQRLILAGWQPSELLMIYPHPSVIGCIVHGRENSRAIPRILPTNCPAFLNKTGSSFGPILLKRLFR